jgi:aspartate/methionine/tyrosine aminotransferase
MNRVYQERRDILMAGLSKVSALRPMKPEGAFYAWARIDDSWQGYEGKRDGWALSSYLIVKGGIGSAPGEVFGPAGAGHIRFAFSCATDQIERAAAALPGLF